MAAKIESTMQPASSLAIGGESESPEAALWSSERQNRRLIETSQDIVWELAIDGLPEGIERVRRGETTVEALFAPGESMLKIRHLYVSPAVERILGYTPEEELARQFGEGFTPESLQRLSQLLVDQVSLEVSGAGARPSQIELDEIHRDGSIIATEVLARPVHNAIGELIGVAGTTRDITQRKRSEAALRRIEEGNRRLIETSQDIIWEMAIDGLPEAVDRIRRGETSVEELLDPAQPKVEIRPLFISPAVEKILGFTPEEALARPYNDKFTPGSRLLVNRMLTEQINGEALGNRMQPIEIELEEFHRDGSIVNMEIRIQPLRDDLGQLVGLAGTSRDITKRKRHMRQQETVAQLGQLAISSSDLEALMDAVVHKLAHTLDVEYCKVLELLPGGDELLLRAGIGWQDGLVGHARVGTERRSQAGYSLDRDEPVIVADFATDSRFSGPPLLHEHGVVSGMSVVIGGLAAPFGVLGVHSREPRVFSEIDVHFLQVCANLLADAIRRDRAERRLAESENWLRTIFETEPECVKILDREGRLKDMNPAGLRMIGAESLDQVRGELILPVIAPEFHQRFVDASAAIFRGESRSLEFEIISLKGDRRWVDSTKVPLRNTDGEITDLLAVTRDVTHSKRALRELRESELRFRQLAENLKQVFWLVERTDLAASKIVYISPAYEQIWARSCDSLYADPMSWIDAIHPDDQALASGTLQRQFHGEATDVVYRILRPDGTVRRIHNRAFPICDDAGTVLRIAGIADDITEKQLAEDALRASEGQLRESLAEKETLLREIHHRVKNNLQIVSSLLHFQGRKLTDPDAAGIIRDGKSRLQAMILVHEQLYRASHLDRIEFGEYIRRLTDEMVRSYESAAGAFELEVTTEPVSLPIETALPLGMIVNELVTNAFKHAHPEGGSGRIEIGLEQAGNELKIRVADDGQGIPDSVDFEHPETFGLQLVRNLVSQIDGTISFQHGRGAVATIVLQFENSLQTEN